MLIAKAGKQEKGDIFRARLNFTTDVWKFEKLVGGDV